MATTPPRAIERRWHDHVADAVTIKRAAEERLSLLPMEMRAGDRITDEEGEWEIIGHPSTLREGKVVHARLRRLDDPRNAKEVSWPAYERIVVRRALEWPATPSPGR